MTKYHRLLLARTRNPEGIGVFSLKPDYRVVKISNINQNQVSHCQNKLQYKIDAWDLHKALEDREDIR